MNQSDGNQSRRSSGPGITILLAIFLGLLFIFGPHTFEIPTESKVMLNIFGVGLILVGGILTVITQLYKRTAADEAFVRTGMGGPKAVIDGGSIVVQVVHETIWMSLRTMRFEVTRKGADSLITLDNLRAEITVEFFVKIPKDPDSVKNAATSLGKAASSEPAIKVVVEKKLESAIRSVAATMTLENLMRERDKFIETVKEHTQTDIKQNGLMLETVTISQLDQTPAHFLQEDNIFDAQGRKKIAEITTRQKVETTKITQEGEQTIATQTTLTKQLVAAQEVLQAKAIAEQDRDISIQRATAKQLADKTAAEQDQIARVAGVERDKAVELAQVDQAKTVDVAAQVREQAVRTAQIAKDQATEVADQQRQVAVANAERDRAEAEAQQLDAEALRAEAEQKVQTVMVKATADRERERVVITAQAEAETNRVHQNMVADVEAYTLVKSAEGERTAAQLRAEARTTLARADSEAKGLEAQGEQALQMVPVAVRQKGVEVEAALVEVEKSRLQNQSDHQEIAKELQIALAEIAAGKEVQIEQAKAMGTAFSTMNMTVWGDPSTVARMSDAFYRGQSMPHTVNGFAANAPEALSEGITNLAAALTSVLKAKNIPVSQEMVEAVLKEAQEKVVTVAAKIGAN